MAVNKIKYVVDASVVLKWFLKEAVCKEEALFLKQDYDEQRIEILIPHYAFAEIFNILGRNLAIDEALACCSRLLNYFLVEYPVTLEMASLAFEIMKKSDRVSFYDAGYHSLAMHEGCVFITADEKYYKKTEKSGHIMLLKNYGKTR